MEERVSAESVTDLRTAKFGIQKRELRNMSLSTRTFGIPLKNGPNRCIAFLWER